MMVVSPKLDDEAIDATLARVNGYINGNGGSVIDQSRWGRLRKLAYPINNFREGNYILTHIEIEPDKTKELEASLILTEDVLRHILLSIESVPQTVSPVVANEATAEVVADEATAEVVTDEVTAEVVTDEVTQKD
jgi:small subunit ribosomal protein S6